MFARAGVELASEQGISQDRLKLVHCEARIWCKRSAAFTPLQCTERKREWIFRRRSTSDIEAA
jgi:hypothetical protein